MIFLLRLHFVAGRVIAVAFMVSCRVETCYWWLLVDRAYPFTEHVLFGYPSHGPHTCQSEHWRRFSVEKETRLRRVAAAGRISLHIAVRVRILLRKACVLCAKL
jgi:hypothetical protein